MFNILCIDDNRNNLFTLENILQQLKDINIISALSAQAGFSILLQQDIDLILLDVQMPEMDGFEAAKLIKATKKTADIPIIFLTAIFHGKEFQQKGFAAGAIEYLSKPIDDNKLLNKVCLYQRLIESEKSLREQQRYMQKIIDLQEQILVVIDKYSFLSANQRFYDFFAYDNLQQFKEEHQCICDFFLEKEGFLPPDLSNNKKNWLEIIINNSDKLHLAIVNHNNTDVILSVHATLLDEHKEMYVVTLNDVTQIHQAKEQFRHDALTDKLTGVSNRTKFDAVLDSAIASSADNVFTMAMIDIDHFKQINDDFGHVQGDRVLKELALLIESNIRSEDLFTRWGGEEFALIFFTSLDKIMLQLEKIRQLVSQTSFSGINRTMTISIGVGEYSQQLDKDSFTRKVDDALYQAKQSGRNCIVKVTA